jgi:hypothetical protein
MTINVAVVTSEALVFGCDSIASVTRYFVNPFECPYERLDDGSLQVSVSPERIMPHVTHAWGGVTKMFALSDRWTPVAAVTAGLAKLNDRSMSSYANQFLSESQVAPPPETVEEMAYAFLRFVRGQYDRHYAGSSLPEEYRDAPYFLVGGYGRYDHLPTLFRVDIQANSVTQEYESGGFGLSWEGQSDAVERLIRGYDTHLRSSVEKQLTAGIETFRKAMGNAAAAMLQKILDKAKIPLPEGISTELPAVPPFSIDWDAFKCNVSYGNLPIQDAVDFASYLVALQSGKSKFASGVATVGGRTHIGVITKAQGFRMLDEPELRHTNVGYSP